MRKIFVFSTKYLYTQLIFILGKRKVWVRSASVVPKHNNVLMAHCYTWIRSASVLPDANRIQNRFWYFNGMNFGYDRKKSTV